MKKLLTSLLTAGLLGLGLTPTIGCPPSGEGEGEGEGEEGEGEEGEGEEGEGEGEEGEGEGEDGTVTLVKAVIDNFIGKAIANNVYNGWFSNGSLDAGLLKNCLVHQTLGAISFEGENYNGTATVAGLADLYDAAGPDVECRSMAEAHTGLKITTAANAALVADLLEAMADEEVPQAVQDLIVAGLGPQFGDIIDEDQDAAGPNQSLYNKYAPADGGGRQTVLTLLIGDDLLGGDEDAGDDECGGEDCFLLRVLSDDTINSFFTGTDVPRLAACLQRQLAGALGGPDDYGSANGLTAIDSALVDGTTVANCVDMVAAHETLEDAETPDDGTAGITKAEFDALAGHAAATLTALGVAAADVGVIAGVLVGDLPGLPGTSAEGACKDIVTAVDDACPVPND